MISCEGRRLDPEELFHDTARPKILMVNPDLGKPTVAEVVGFRDVFLITARLLYAILNADRWNIFAFLPYKWLQLTLQTHMFYQISEKRMNF